MPMETPALNLLVVDSVDLAGSSASVSPGLGLSVWSRWAWSWSWSSSPGEAGQNATSYMSLF